MKKVYLCGFSSKERYEENEIKATSKFYDVINPYNSFEGKSDNESIILATKFVLECDIILFALDFYAEKCGKAIYGLSNGMNIDRVFHVDDLM